ncbi:MAG TPA: alkaline phosphatase family protein [Vicinamibacterales bacterium]|nr:alkaline phosphatase family protein [Vicinamibacterales bacterium]
MRRLALLILAAGVFATSLTIRAADPPRLLVIVVVDQMRADYLQRFDRHWRGGFRTLLDKGLVFENARYPYLVTVTCAGHATIGTGALPHTHGMVNNTWWDRKARALTGCSADGATSDITYGRPVRLGNSAAHLMVPTLADELRAQKPGARVAALSMKARSAIMLAGHAADAAVWFDDLSGSWTTSKAFASGPVAEVKAFVDENPYEKDLGRIWNLGGPANTYLMRDAGVGERPPAGWNGLFPHVITGRGGIDAQFFTLWQATPLADAYLARMAASLVDSFALGQRQTTDFLGISFSVLDDVGHAFGPDSREVEDVLRQLDVTLGTLIAHLDARVGRANYVLALSADHGVAPIAVSPKGGRIATDDVRERIEDALTTEWGRLEKGTYVDAVNFTDVYFAAGVFDRLRANPKLMASVTRAVEEIPGVARALRGDQLSHTSQDPLIRRGAMSYLSSRNGDLMVVPKEYWYFSGRNVSPGTTHGTSYDYDTHVPLILFGGSVKPGRATQSATPADIAPTLAELAGIRLPNAEGRALIETDR